jgi:hypothetical protein
LDILFKPFGFPAPKDFTIIWLSNILYLSVPDEGFSRILSCISVVIKHKLYLMLIVVDETFVADLIMSVTNDNM